MGITVWVRINAYTDEQTERHCMNINITLLFHSNAMDRIIKPKAIPILISTINFGFACFRNKVSSSFKIISSVFPLRLNATNRF